MQYDIEKSGKRIRQLRIKNGLTQEKVAAALNINRRFYSRVESGKNGCSVDLLVQLSVVFSTSIDYIVLGKECYNVPTIAFTDELRSEIDSLTQHLEEFKSKL